MKETGIIMSGDHPKLILDGIKTMTRRVIKMKPWFSDLLDKMDDNMLSSMSIKCPYGQVGDRLWVRETWYYYGGDEYMYQQNPRDVVYKSGHIADPETGMVFIPKWRPSIHMPRWASRITLEITDIRVERVQEISREDIRAEGVILPPSPRFTPRQFSELHQEFASLWDSLNAKRGYGWEVNPWVWVISFKLLERNIK